MEIQSLKRKPQLYIDLYSKRDGITNKRIEEFNKTLNRTFFNKKHSSLRKKKYNITKQFTNLTQGVKK